MLKSSSLPEARSPSQRIDEDRRGHSSSSEVNDENEPRRSRSLSPSSFDSASSSSINISQMNEDDSSSLDENNVRLADLEEHYNILRMLIPDWSTVGADTRPKTDLSLLECQICLESCPLRPLFCCSSNVCSACSYSHLSSKIIEAQIRVPCPCCSHIFTREEIIGILGETDKDGQLTDRYKRFYADINGEAHVKTCPQCCSIKQFDKKLFEGVRWKKNAPRRVVCDECLFVWCFFCHAPWHEKMSCKDYQQGERLLKDWASQKDQNQQNAQQCPRCKIYISRNGGCPHMICTKCHCDFCYNCGKRRYGIKFLGSHESRFSPFGCKYNLYPDKPILRHTVRGLVVGAATLAAPVAAVGALALLAVGTTIGAPTYGTYKLVKHIKTKREHRRFLSRSAGNNEENSSMADDDDDDYRRALQASIDTFREETAKRQDPPANAGWTDEDDDESLDD